MNDDMNAKKLYVWRLATFLYGHDMKMSGSELADHLNRNNFLTSSGNEFKSGIGPFNLIRATWHWVHDDLGLEQEAENIANAFVDADGGYAWIKEK